MDSECQKNKFVAALDFSAGNLDAAWTKFKSQFKVYAKAKGHGKLSAEEQVCNMLVCMGPESVQIYDQFVYDNDAHKLTVKNVMGDFDKHFQPVKNVIYERMVFNQLAQKPGQTIHQFITEVRSQVAHCEYGGIADEMVRDRIVVGVRDSKLRECLVDIDDLDLQKCVQKAKQFTSSRAQMAHMVPDNLDAVMGSPEKRKTTTTTSMGRRGASAPTNCYFCGKENHPRDQCPAKRSRCNRCQEVGHWGRGRACPGKKRVQSRSLHAVAGNDDEVTEVLVEECEDLYVGSISA